MHRRELLERLTLYRMTWATAKWCRDSDDMLREVVREEFQNLARLEAFVRARGNCFERSCLAGHVTASALITNPAMDSVLLTHHRKLDKWLQLGGHCDGDPCAHRTAQREAEEESGLKGFTFFPLEKFFSLEPSKVPAVFDVDVHAIPETHKEPAHHHYDVRYLLIANDMRGPVVSNESHDLKWMPLSDARQITGERSMLRMFDKFECVKRCVSLGSAA